MKQLQILSDLHHAGLYNSLILLLEKRLGHKLYRPIGMEWWNEGFWDVYHHEDTAKQYLLDGYYPKDHTPPLNSVTKIENGIHYIHEGSQDCTHKAITLEQFKEMPIDVVIASIPQHIKPFKDLIAKYKPKAKFIFQQGNMFHEVINNLHEIPNLLSSTINITVPGNCNAVFYHQEFDLTLFKPNGSRPEKRITSFINLLPKTQHAPLYYEMKSGLPEFDFKSYGILTDDGIISGIDKIASIMKSSMLGWHCKYMGDGFGHVLFNWFASGRPVIIKISDYKDKLGAELLTDDETCIDLDSHPMSEVCEMIRNFSPNKYEYMCQQAFNRFQEKVDYDTEAGKIKTFLENLQ